jgi:hypothetical protein
MNAVGNGQIHMKHLDYLIYSTQKRVMGCFVEEDILYWKTLCSRGRFIGWTFCTGECFVAEDVL